MDSADYHSTFIAAKKLYFAHHFCLKVVTHITQLILCVRCISLFSVPIVTTLLTRRGLYGAICNTLKVFGGSENKWHTYRNISNGVH